MSTLLLALVLSQRLCRRGRRWLSPIAAAIGIALFIRHENRFPEPILRPALFADLDFTIPNIVSVLVNLAGFTILLLTPYYLANMLDALGFGHWVA